MASDAVRFALAAILFVAAVLKTHQLATEPVLGSGLLGSRWFLIGVVQFELLLAFWLASGLAIRCACWVSLAAFSLFAVVAAAKAIAGDASCGCFGRVATSPWVAFAMDVSAVLALWWCRPCRSSAWGQRSPALPARVSTSIELPRISPRLALGWLAAATSLGCGPIWGVYSDRHAATAHAIVVDPDAMLGNPFELAKHIDIGNLFAKGRWLVVFHRSGCRDCETLITKWPQIAHQENARAL